MRRESIIIASLALAAMLTACGEDGGGSDPDPFEPTAYCPGPGCPDEEGVGPLEVGAGMADITAIDDDGNYVATGEPPEVLTVDVDGDLAYDPEDGDEFDDVNGNGEYDGVWIAGFRNGLGAQGVHDKQWARAIALRHENTTMVLVSLDCIGYFKNEMDLVRGQLGDLDVDHVFFSSTHVHEAHDTVGLWGPTQTESGARRAYLDFVADRAADAVRAAVDALEPSHVQYVSFRLRDLQDIPPEGSPQGMARFVGDGRDPNIIDDEVRVLRFRQAAGDATIATLVNWSAHPEYTGSQNPLLTSDYVHFIREGLENGVEGPEGPVDGVGGMAVYFTGALGNQIGPNRVRIINWEGDEIGDDVPPVPEEDSTMTSSAGVVGTQLAYYILQALRGDLAFAQNVEDETAEVGFRTKQYYLHLQNRAFFVASQQGIFDRDLHEWDPSLPVSEDNEPAIDTEVTVIDIGRAQLISSPGELGPELFIGGYQGEHTPEGQDLVDPENPNPPPLDQAPGPPYLRDLARDDAEVVFLMGCANDYVGYIIPDYNFVLHETTPWFEQAPGDHYEETNSPGDQARGDIEAMTRSLLEWSPDA
ncbi:MAG: hypothetical protein ACODAU_11595 [Myxococcota bacterium]